MSTITKRPSFLAKIASFIERIGRDPAESDDMRLQRMLLLGICLAVAFAGAVWGLLYVLLEEILAGAIPLSYALLSFLSVIFFGATRRYNFFRFSQLLLILLLPFLLMIALGGFVNSSAVILWALLAPLGALTFSEPRSAPRWFLAYLALVVVSGLLQPSVRVTNNLSAPAIRTFFVMNIGGVSTASFIMIYYFVGQKNSFFQLLHIEQDRSERLLLNILPAEIAKILKVEQRIIADHYDMATIMFADLVGFTPLSAEMEPVETVNLLNEIYSRFDDLVEKHSLEKIRTIGDNYMVVSGVPIPRLDHAQALADMALEMRAYLDNFTTQTGKRLQFRIGINSGPLVAGVVGRKKFQYDVWGDAVNIASRMESHGEPGKIHITGVTRELLGEAYAYEPRGAMKVKGKGEMETWFLVGRRSMNGNLQDVGDRQG